jgi:hypothetical protein
MVYGPGDVKYLESIRHWVARLWKAVIASAGGPRASGKPSFERVYKNAPIVMIPKRRPSHGRGACSGLSQKSRYCIGRILVSRHEYCGLNTPLGRKLVYGLSLVTMSVSKFTMGRYIGRCTCWKLDPVEVPRDELVCDVLWRDIRQDGFQVRRCL